MFGDAGQFTKWCRETLKYRMIRPEWAEEKYLIGNEKNGWICAKISLDEWEAKYPCEPCYSKEICYSPCKVYEKWLELSPLKRIQKK